MLQSRSKGLCIICSQKLQPPPSTLSDSDYQISQRKEAEICKRFFILISRYLGFNPGFSNTFCTLYTKQDNLSNLDPCAANCFPMLQSFCNMYDLWQVLQLEINRCVDCGPDRQQVEGKCRTLSSRGAGKF